MVKELLVSSSLRETKVAILEEDQLAEVYFENADEYSIAGSIYKGRVTRVLPGMQSAFVDIGLDRDAFLYVSDFLEDTEVFDKYDKIDAGLENGGAPVGEASAPAPSRTPATPPPPAPVPVAEARVREASREASPEAPAPAGAVPDHRRRGRRRSRRRRFHDRGFPQAKYANWADVASHRGQAEVASHRGQAALQPSVAAPSFAPIVLPGESLAKYRHLAPSQSESFSPAEPWAEQDGEPEEIELREEPARGTALEPERREVQQEQSASPEPEAALASELAPELREPLAPEPERVPADTHSSESAPEAVPEATPSLESAVSLEPIEQPEPPEPPAVVEENNPAARESVEPQAAWDQEPQAGIVADEESGDAGEGEEEAEAGDEGDGEESSVATAGGEPAVEPATEGAPAPGPRFGRRLSRRMRRKLLRESRQAQPQRPQVPAEPAARTQPLISDLLREGQEILVQVAKEPLGKKGARITSHIALPGRYLVYMPTLEHVGVSRKVTSEEERQRLKRIILQAKRDIPGGFIVRTAGEGRSEQELLQDVRFLHQLWLEIRTKAERSPAPALLHHDLNLVERILRDHLSEEFRAIWVDNEQEYENVLQFVQSLQPVLVSRVKLYTKDTPLFEEFNVQEEISKALKPKVWLKSGGYIVINQTEALVAIDVNTGKFVGKSNRLEDTIVKTNVDAIQEIVRQIRLRDLGGIIVIDFIDMDERKNRQKVMAALEEALKADRAPCKILSFNEFGLVAITRKRVRQSLERTLCQPCAHCGGSGFVKSVASVCCEISTEARKMAADLAGRQVTLRVHPEVGKALKARDNTILPEIEEMSGRPVVVRNDPALDIESFAFE
ncbi:MAG: Rne/Rng family ribonuclease [Acidobacteria bacterium]|nr:Rne/Rng family ribonuclease [Acidobacteriota bacterium]